MEGLSLLCGHRIMAITSAFQADDAGSIPAARSSKSFPVCDDGLPGVTGQRPYFECALFLQNCDVKKLTFGLSAHPKASRENPVNLGWFVG